MPIDAAGHTFSIGPVELARLIDKTRFAISTEETRYYLNGIFFHAVVVNGAPMLRAVATDGHRLALADCPAPEGSVGMGLVLADLVARAHGGGLRLHDTERGFAVELMLSNP